MRDLHNIGDNLLRKVKGVFDWLAAITVVIIGGCGIWQFVRYSLKEHRDWAEQERYRYLSELDPDDIDFHR